MAPQAIRALRHAAVAPASAGPRTHVRTLTPVRAPDVIRARRRVLTVSLMMSSQSFQVLLTTGLALFLPVIRADLGMSFTDAGSLAATATLTYALLQIPAGYLSDRLGPRRVFVVGVVGSLVLSCLFGVLRTYGQALAVLTLFGMFRALLFAPGVSLLSSSFPPERRATGMALYIAGVFSGNILLSLVGPPLVERFGWRFPFLAFPLAGLLIVFAYLRLGRDTAAMTSGAPPGISDAFRLFREPIMWICGVLQFIRLGVVMGIAFWLPSLLVEDRGLSLGTVGLIGAMSAALTLAFNTIGGYLSDRLGSPTLVIGGSLLMLSVTSGLLVTVHDIRLLMVVIAVNAMFAQFYFGPLFAVPLEVLGARRAGLSTGFSNFFGNLGSLAFAYGLGVVKDARGSFTLGFMAIAAACVVGMVFTVMLARMRNTALVSPPVATGLPHPA
jgi:nitrate/nitrite transporter NarK